MDCVALSDYFEDMFAQHHETECLVVIYCHEFDDATGLYVRSAPAGLCRENDLVSSLAEAAAGVRHGSYLLEPVFLDELSAADRRELTGRLLRSDALSHQAAWSLYRVDGSVPAAG